MTPKPKNDIEDSSPEETNNKDSAGPEIDKWSNLIYGDDVEADKPIATASVWKQPSPTKPKKKNDKDWQKIIYGEKFYNDNIAAILDDWDEEDDNDNWRSKYKWRSFAKLPKMTEDLKWKIGQCFFILVSGSSAILVLVLIVVSRSYNLHSDFFLPNGKTVGSPQFETGDATLRIDSEVDPFVTTATNMRTIQDDKNKSEMENHFDHASSQTNGNIETAGGLVEEKLINNNENTGGQVEEHLWFDTAIDDDVRKLFEVPPLLRGAV